MLIKQIESGKHIGGFQSSFSIYFRMAVSLGLCFFNVAAWRFVSIELSMASICLPFPGCRKTVWAR